MRKLYSSIAICFFILSAFAQNDGSIKGTVFDKDSKTKDPVPFANVVVEQGGAQILGTGTDLDGNFFLKPLQPGKYTVKATFSGYQTVQINDVLVTTGKITFLDVPMSASVEMKEIEIVDYKIPVFEKDNTTQGGTVTAEDVKTMAVRDVNAIASTTAGVYQQDNGDAINMRGGRDDATAYYVNGVKVIGSTALPKGSIEQLSVITGGIPAQYGDVTGGIVSVTTKGPSKNFSGGLEAYSSRLFDQYNNDLIGFSLTGPLLMSKDSLNRKPIVGFFIAGEAEDKTDHNPSAMGVYQVTDGILEDLKENPLSLSSTGTGTVRNAEYITAEDMKLVDVKPNNSSSDLRLSSSFDIKPSRTTNLTFGGSFAWSERTRYDRDYELFNYENLPVLTYNTWRVFGRFTQNFLNSDDNADSKSLIKNVYYSLQAGFEKVDDYRQDAVHRDNFFNYGYVGKFDVYQAPNYTYMSDSINGELVTAYYLTSHSDTLVEFTPSDINPDKAAYTNAYYDLVGGNSDITSLDEINAGGGLRNGDEPLNVYSLWFNTGYQPNFYYHVDKSKYSFNFQGSADIKDHAISFGFEYEQRDIRYFSVYQGEYSLWTIMRQLANKHLSQLDLDNPVMVTDGNGNFQDTVNYEFLYDETSQALFDYNLREDLGLNPTGTDIVNIDALDPTTFSLSMFSAEELLNDGNALVSYSGYDHAGNRLTSIPTLDDFFNEKDGDYYTRPIASFRPIYMAAFLQDKFSFRDLIFNIGLRVDRYDANQSVLSDQYLLYPAKTAGEVSNFGDHPDNIGEDYVVYVNDLNNPTSIVGYRNEGTWYDADGAEVSDPTDISDLTTTGQITPYLVDPDAEMSSSSFKDYIPQINLMPRVAFSFPISDEAVFFAHYDVLTQRPILELTSGNTSALDPTDYLYIQNKVGAELNNPNLKPEKTIDYELGFKQKLTNSSAISLSAFYRELRDMIQVVNVKQAYPISYTTYENIDFGTVKGFTVGFDMRRTGNIKLSTSYTLQFASGTGSDGLSGRNLANSGQPNLKAIFPLDYDQRHSILIETDYRYAGGADYNGPLLFGKAVFAFMGANLIFRAGSGTPYTQQKDITQGNVSDGALVIGVSQRSTYGVQNALRLPWTYRFDLRVDKSIPLTFGGKTEGSSKREAELMIYIDVLNLLNTKNVVGVYEATGSPTDDGYLSSAAAQASIEAQTDPLAYTDQYNVKMLNYNHYTQPRRMQLGIMFNF
jgi:outer membrane receptor protein involved in Fe transport